MDLKAENNLIFILIRRYIPFKQSIFDERRALSFGASDVAQCMRCDARASPKITTPKFFFFINLNLFRAFFIFI